MKKKLLYIAGYGPMNEPFKALELKKPARCYFLLETN